VQAGHAVERGTAHDRKDQTHLNCTYSGINGQKILRSRKSFGLTWSGNHFPDTPAKVAGLSPPSFRIKLKNKAHRPLVRILTCATVEMEKS
jgi:hypothetical protein